MNNKTAKLIDSNIGVALSILLTWCNISSNEKEKLSVEQLECLFHKTLANSIEEKDILDLIKNKIINHQKRNFDCKNGLYKITDTEWKIKKNKAKSFRSLQLLWAKTLPNTEIELEILILLRKNIKSFNHCKWLLKRVQEINTELKEVWKIAINKARNFDDYKWLWINSIGTVNEASGYQLVINKAKSLNDYHSLWLSFFINSKEKIDAFNQIKKIVKTFKQCQWLLENSPDDDIYRDKIWNLLMLHAQNNKDLKYLWKTAKENTIEETEVISLIRKINKL